MQFIKSHHREPDMDRAEQEYCGVQVKEKSCNTP